MKHFADKGRSEREFAMGDMVYLRLQPYIQSSVAPRSNHKLSFRYYGPFAVLARVAPVAYKLQLPDTCRIHPVVHVSQLKRHVPPSVRNEDDISQVPDDPMTPVTPIQFLDSRSCRLGASSVTQILVRWKDLPSSLTTWEEVEDLHRRYPRCPAWGQAGSQEGGNVKTKTRREKRTSCTVARPASQVTDAERRAVRRVAERSLPITWKSS